MKNLTKILLVLALIAMVTPGCEKAKSLLDVKFDTSFKTNLNVDIPAGTLRSINASFFEEATIDPSADANIAQYGSNIKNVSITGVTGTVLTINKPVTLTTATMTVASSGYDSGVWTFTNQAIAVGTSLTLDNAGGQWDKVNNILNSLNAFTVTLQGEADQDDVQFTLEFQIDVEVTANPL